MMGLFFPRSTDKQNAYLIFPRLNVDAYDLGQEKRLEYRHERNIDFGGQEEATPSRHTNTLA